MEVVHLDDPNFNLSEEDTVYTIGNFDGVHLGHIELFNATKEIAHRLNCKWGVLTFTPNTKQFLGINIKKLTTREQQLHRFNSLKIPKIVVVDFKKVYNLCSYNFIYYYLVKCLKAKALVVGNNFSMGKDLLNFNISINKPVKADPPVCLDFCNSFNLANSYAKKYIYYNSVLNLQVYTISVKTMNKYVISSSYIKRLLNEGNIKEVNKLLGYNFTVRSEVIHGNKLGRTLGFPTINMLIPQYEKLKYGIYVTRTHLPNKVIKNSVSNFGIRPTIVNSPKEEVLETYILDYNGDLYGQQISVEFIDYIREEKKFNTLEELVDNIKLDIIKARVILDTNKEKINA